MCVRVCLRSVGRIQQLLVMPEIASVNIESDGRGRRDIPAGSGNGNGSGYGDGTEVGVGCVAPCHISVAMERVTASWTAIADEVGDSDEEGGSNEEGGADDRVGTSASDRPIHSVTR